MDYKCTDSLKEERTRLSIDTVATGTLVALGFLWIKQRTRVWDLTKQQLLD